MRKCIVQSYMHQTLGGDIIPFCLDTVKEWTLSNQHEYNFIGDEITSYVPPSLRAKLNAAENGHVILRDVAKLFYMDHLFSYGYGHVTWINPDVLVTDEEQFNPVAGSEFALGIDPVSFRRSLNTNIVSACCNSYMFQRFVQRVYEVIQRTPSLLLHPSLIDPFLLTESCMPCEDFQTKSDIFVLNPVHYNFIMNDADPSSVRPVSTVLWPNAVAVGFDGTIKSRSALRDYMTLICT